MALCLSATHLVAWGLSVFGEPKMGGPWALLCWGAARGSDMSGVWHSVWYALVPSILIAASGWTKRRWLCAYAGLVLSSVGWMPLALRMSRGWPDKVSWMPYLSLWILIVIYAWPGMKFRGDDRSKGAAGGAATGMAAT
jgi:hypothetical protein